MLQRGNLEFGGFGKDNRAVTLELEFVDVGDTHPTTLGTPTPGRGRRWGHPPQDADDVGDTHPRTLGTPTQRTTPNQSGGHPSSGSRGRTLGTPTQRTTPNQSGGHPSSGSRRHVCATARGRGKRTGQSTNRRHAATPRLEISGQLHPASATGSGSQQREILAVMIGECE